MKRGIVIAIVGAASAVALLAVACATAPTPPAEGLAARATQLRLAVAEVVAEPARRRELTAAIDAMEKAMVDSFAETVERNREFVAISADPGASRERLEEIAGQHAAFRRDALRAAMSARIRLRGSMTTAEWRAFASRLPAFDEVLP